MDDPLIYKQLAKVGQDLKSVGMSDMKRYKARHIYDVYNMIQPLLAKHGIVLGRKNLTDNCEYFEKDGYKPTDPKRTATRRYQLWQFKFYAEDGSCFETEFPGESEDYGDKAASQCDAMAYKQMLIHTFQIPTKDMQEPDDKPLEETINKSENKKESPPTKFDPPEIVFPLKEPVKKATPKKLVTEKQLRLLMVRASKAKVEEQEINKIIMDNWKLKSKKELDWKQFDSLLKTVTARMPK